MTTNIQAKIQATDLNGVAKLQFIPRHFGARMLMRAEALINGTLRSLCEDYTGGDWRFVELSNGGFFMAPSYAPPKRKTPRPAPPGTMRLCVPGNFVDVDVTPEAAGIIATLYVLCQLADPEDDYFAEAYHRLLDFTRQHAECSSIDKAID